MNANGLHCEIAPLVRAVRNLRKRVCQHSPRGSVEIHNCLRCSQLSRESARRRTRLYLAREKASRLVRTGVRNESNLLLNRALSSHPGGEE